MWRAPDRTRTPIDADADADTHAVERVQPPRDVGTSPIVHGTEKFRVPPEAMPYPYTTPTPPPTPVDGTYLRILTLEDVDGLLPLGCLRCPPYSPNAGVSTLILHRGNYWPGPVAC